MVRFVSFLLGLVVGVHPIEVSVGANVARVEIRLNGTTVAEMRAGPWRRDVDLGSELRPAVMEALAYDGEGRLVGRDRQWLNLPRPPADAALLPVTGEDGRITGAHIHWMSAEFSAPKKVNFHLDGEARPPSSDNSVDLTDVDENELHLLDAEVVFPGGIRLRRHLVFGKGSSGELDLSLTAVPVLVSNPNAFVQPEEWDGWFLVRGEPVEVADFEKGEARLVIVRGPGADKPLEALLERMGRDEPGVGGDRLDDDVLVSVVGTIPAGGPRGDVRLFPVSDPESVGHRGLAVMLDKARFAELQFGLRRLADAVALAGLEACGSNRRRAVLLILGRDQDDVSNRTPAEVRAYLESLRVPMVVFDVASDDAAAEPWRPVDEVIDPMRWRSSVRWLQEDLDSQRIVWLVGRHLPSDVTLGPKARGIELAR